MGSPKLQETYDYAANFVCPNSTEGGTSHSRGYVRPHRQIDCKKIKIWQGYTNIKRREKMVVLTAIIHKEEDMYVAECPEVGTVSQGKTIEEAIYNLKEATELYLEEFPLEEKEHPFLTTFEISIKMEGKKVAKA